MISLLENVEKYQSMSMQKLLRRISPYLLKR